MSSDRLNAVISYVEILCIFSMMCFVWYTHERVEVLEQENTYLLSYAKHLNDNYKGVVAEKMVEWPETRIQPILIGASVTFISLAVITLISAFIRKPRLSLKRENSRVIEPNNEIKPPQQPPEQ